MRKKLRRYILIAAMLLSGVGCSADDFKIGPIPSSVPVADTSSALKARELRWQTENWTGNDRAFRQVRNHIEASLKQNVSIDSLLDVAENNAVKSPYDSIAQFTWCYLAYKSVKMVKPPNGSDPKFARLGQRLINATQGMIFGTQPHSYEYSRLLFLARATSIGPEGLAVIGQRLLNHNSEDDEVRVYMIDIYEDTQPLQTQKALDSARYLLRKNPSNAFVLQRLGDIYFLDFCAHKHKEDAKDAIAYWHKAYQIEPARYDARLMQSNLSYMRKIEATKEYKEING